MMAWLDPHASVLSYRLIGTSSEATLDLFPSRITFHGDPNEALGALLAAALDGAAGSGWNIHSLPSTYEVLHHPLATFHDGAYRFHRGTPLPGHGTWAVDGDEVVAPDGQRFDARTFTFAPAYDFTSNTARRHRDEDRCVMETMDHAVHVARGVMLGLDGLAPIASVGSMCYLFQTVEACWAEARHRAPGQKIRQARTSTMRDMWDAACNTWRVRCDRPYAPRAYVVQADAFPAPQDPVHQALQQAGFAATRLLMGVGVQPYDLANLSNPSGFVQLTAHQRLSAEKAFRDASRLFEGLA